MCNEHSSGGFMPKTLAVGNRLVLRENFNTQVPRPPINVLVDDFVAVNGVNGPERMVSLRVQGAGTPAYTPNECMLMSVDRVARMYQAALV